MSACPNAPLDELKLSTRARNVLRRLGCTTLGSIVAREYAPSSPGLGKGTRAEVASLLEVNGLTPPAGLLPSEAARADVAADVLRQCERMECELRRCLEQMESLKARVRRHL